MRTGTISAIASVFLFQIGTAFASSVLIEKTNGTATAAILPADACPVSVMKVRPAPADREFYYFNPADGLVLRALRRPGYVTDWEVSLNNTDPTSGSRGNMLQAQFYGDANTKTLDYAGMREDSPAYKALQKIYPDKSKSCLGYMSSFKSRFFETPLDDIEKITFYDDDAKANTESAALEKKRQAELARLNAQVVAWRKKMQPGSEAHCGMVIELKSPLVKVQTAIGEKWFKADQLYPAGQRNCTFINGVYQN